MLYTYCSFFGYRSTTNWFAFMFFLFPNLLLAISPNWSYVCACFSYSTITLSVMWNLQLHACKQHKDRFPSSPFFAAQHVIIVNRQLLSMWTACASVHACVCVLRTLLLQSAVFKVTPGTVGGGGATVGCCDI